MKYKKGDIVSVPSDQHWRKRKKEKKFLPVGIILNTYEGKNPSYCVLIGFRKDWKYEEDLAPLLSSVFR